MKRRVFLWVIWLLLVGRCAWERARKAPLSLEQVSHKTESPLDPYTVGLSFVLYVKSRVGEEGLTKLAVNTARTNRFYEAVEEVLGEPFYKMEPKWLEFIRSDQFRMDTDSF